ncbi:MAG: molybdenum cofactor guanylyltransferase [Acidobacteriaceae bacterium]|jgi:molybdopterin-guanine dinucleotide biosynthesis protein A
MAEDVMHAEGFVLAGGRSTRMGQDKALLRLGGRTLIDLALEKLRALSLAAARIAGASPELGSYGAVIADLHPGCGPLSGIEAALAASSQPLNAFLPVDTPLLPAQFLLWMLERALITGALATVPRINGWPQPLCAVYHRELLSPITAALAAGDYKVMPVISAACHLRQSIDVFDVEGVASAQPYLFSFSALPLYRWFHNCNTPEDMAGIGML